MECELAGVSRPRTSSCEVRRPRRVHPVAAEGLGAMAGDAQEG